MYVHKSFWNLFYVIKYKIFVTPRIPRGLGPGTPGGSGGGEFFLLEPPGGPGAGNFFDSRGLETLETT